VLTDITPDNPAYTEEFFGPVAQVYRVGSEEEAVELANDTPYGLGSYVFTTDKDQALRVADRIEAGMVLINAVGLTPRLLPHAPRLSALAQTGWVANMPEVLPAVTCTAQATLLTGQRARVE